jgi:hypothetical protein
LLPGILPEHAARIIKRIAVGAININTIERAIYLDALQQSISNIFVSELKFCQSPRAHALDISILMELLSMMGVLDASDRWDDK